MTLSHSPAEAAVLTYFADVKAVIATGAGVAETSYYPALFALLGAVGQALRPRVYAVNHLSNLGVGIPDGGFFDATQLGRGEGEDVLKGQLPSRGALEVKSPKETVADIATGKQVAKYLELYGLVLVTNLRGFALYRKGETGPLEHYELAPDAATFRTLLGSEERTAHAAPLAEFLTRALLANAPLTSPEGVAWFLASYAREAKHRLEHAPLSELAPLKTALSKALALTFEGEQGERFFRATLVQTLWYGLFSAWVLHNERHNGTPFNWRMAAWELHLPVMQSLFSQLANPSAQRTLNLADLLDRTAATLERVEFASFATKFQGDAVQYFYEPFLAAYDPELRKQFGVWYTPAEVVEYMVERVDRALRQDLGLGLGLADPSVYVLDPATGTGSYLTAALKRIERTLREQPDWDDASAADLKRAATERLFGFEIMPAPYVIAHMRMGQRLAALGDGATLKEGERAAIYLTNALTNWKDAPPRLDFAELQAEQDAAQQVKQHQPILVILGNPPYSAFVGTSATEEGGLIDLYKEGLVKEWGIRKFNLDDLYVRFFRIAERKIGEVGRGIVCFISPYSYLSDPSFVVMRRTLLGEFDRLSIDNLNGDSRETGKRTPEGLPDPSIFSTRLNRAGIRSGTAIALMVKTGQQGGQQDAEPQVQYREFWGAGKGAALLKSLGGSGPSYQAATPTPENRHSLRPVQESGEYAHWPKVVDLAGVAPFNGPIERRGLALIDMDKSQLVHRVESYFNAEVDDATVDALHPKLMMTGNRIVGSDARRKLLAEHVFDAANIVMYPFKPFDVRFAYLANIRPLFSEPSPQLLSHRSPENSFFITRDTADKAAEGVPFLYSSQIVDYDALSGHARHFPILLNNPQSTSDGLFAAPPSSTRANLSPRARAYLSELGAPDADSSPAAAALLWHHALAVGFSAVYLSEHAGGIAADWPRIPLPASLEVLTESAQLGARVAELLDNPQAEVAPELGAVGRLKKVDDAAAAAQGYEVRAGWGTLQRGNVVMPGRGRTTERAAAGLPPEVLAELGGERVLDVALNDGWVWENVPLGVWEYTIGGYQVIKKWLSYREYGVLGRALTLEEAREVSRLARRLAELVRLGPALDANYARVCEDVWGWEEE